MSGFNPIEPIQLTLAGASIIGVGLGYLVGVFNVKWLDKKLIRDIGVREYRRHYYNILKSFGITFEDGEWQMKPEDRDEVWVKKED